MSKYLYEEIKDYLIGLIRNNKNVPHYKLPSENQLAMKFSTTRITAKRALTELQDAGYIYRIHGKGSFIQPDAVEKEELKTNDFICMLLPNIESRFIANLVGGARRLLKEYGYHLIILSEKEEELNSCQLIKRIVDLGVKGIIVFPNSRARYNKDLLLLALNKFPVVFVDRTLRDFDVSSVTSDHINIARKGVQLLFDRGCKNVGFITMPSEYSSSIARRISGYEKAHVDNERRILSRNLLYVTKQETGQVDHILNYFRQNPKLDGLLSYGGEIGFNVYRAIQKAGIQVPDDLKVIFFDDEYAEFCDILPFSPTCICQRSTEIGTRAAELMINYIAKKTVTIDKILVDCDIVERESTSCRTDPASVAAAE